MREKPCGSPFCSKIIYERKGPKEFDGRQFCCAACAVAGRPKAFSGTKSCTRSDCDKLIHSRKHEGPSDFAARKYCSPECQMLGADKTMAHIWRPREPGERRRKPCRRCNNEVVQYPNEGIKKWEARPYCCKACARDARREAARIAKPPPGTRRKGNQQPREVRFVTTYSSAKVEAAVNRLRRTTAVFPAAVVHRPDREPAGEHHQWVVGTRQMTTEELLAAAAAL